MVDWAGSGSAPTGGSAAHGAAWSARARLRAPCARNPGPIGQRERHRPGRERRPGVVEDRPFQRQLQSIPVERERITHVADGEMDAVHATDSHPRAPRHDPGSGRHSTFTMPSSSPRASRWASFCNTFRPVAPRPAAPSDIPGGGAPGRKTAGGGAETQMPCKCGSDRMKKCGGRIQLTTPMTYFCVKCTRFHVRRVAGDRCDRTVCAKCGRRRPPL